MYWQESGLCGVDEEGGCVIDASQYASLDEAIAEANRLAPGSGSGLWGATVYLRPNRRYVVQRPPAVIRRMRVRIVGGGPTSVVGVAADFLGDPAPDVSGLPDELAAELNAAREIAILEIRAGTAEGDGTDPGNFSQKNAYDVSLEDFAIDGAALRAWRVGRDGEAATRHAAVGVRVRSAGRMTRLRNLRITNCLRADDANLDSWNELGAGVSVENDANTCLLDSLDIADCDEGVRLPAKLSRGALWLERFVRVRDLLADAWRELTERCAGGGGGRAVWDALWGADGTDRERALTAGLHEELGLPMAWPDGPPADPDEPPPFGSAERLARALLSEPSRYTDGTAAWFREQYARFENCLVGSRDAKDEPPSAHKTFEIQASNHVTIANSTIRNCRIHGVRAEGGAVPKILSCSIEGCGRRGVAFSAVRNGIIEGCRFLRNGYRYVLPHDERPTMGTPYWNWTTGYVLANGAPDPAAGPLAEQREDWFVYGGDDKATFSGWSREQKARLDVGCEVGQVVLGAGPVRDIPEQREGVTRKVPGTHVEVARSYVNPGGHVMGAQVVGCTFDGGWRFDESIDKQMGELPDAPGESVGALVAVLANEVAAANLIGCHFEGHRYTSVLLRSYWWKGSEPNVSQNGATAAVVLANHYADPLTAEDLLLLGIDPEDGWVSEAGTHVLELRPPERGWTRLLGEGTVVDLFRRDLGPCNLDYDRALWGYSGSPEPDVGRDRTR